MAQKMTFTAWMAAVDKNLVALCGLDNRDLADCCYHDWYDDGVSAKAAAKKALRNQ